VRLPRRLQVGLPTRVQATATVGRPTNLQGVDDTIVIPVPERLLSVYAVATAQPPEQAAGSGDGLAVSIEPIDLAPLPPAALLRATGASVESLARLGIATHAVLVRSVGSVGFPPAAELAAYTAAETIAAASDGLVIDTVIPRIVAQRRAIDRDFRLADWVVLPHSVEAGLLWFTSKGMSRFGLPELQSRGIPENLTSAWGAVLTGIAQVLLSGHASALADDPRAAFRELPAEQEVTLRDIAMGYSDHARLADNPTLDVAAAFRIALDPATVDGEDAFIAVLAPSDFRGSTAQWATQIVRRLFLAPTD